MCKCKKSLMNLRCNAYAYTRTHFTHQEVARQLIFFFSQTVLSQLGNQRIREKMNQIVKLKQQYILENQSASYALLFLLPSQEARALTLAHSLSHSMLQKFFLRPNVYYICMYMHTCMYYACMYVYVCMYVCMYVCVCIDVYTICL